MRSGTRSALAALIATAGITASTAQAVPVFAIDDDPGQHLIAFDSATPGTLNSVLSITGLQPNEKLIGIDFRISASGINQNALYGVGSFGRIYTLNLSTGAATFVAGLTDGVNPILLNGAEFGFDFDPQADRLRLVSDLDQNLRVNVDTGVTVVDSPLNPLNPNVTHLAYDRSDQVAGTATTLFGIDTVTNQLVGIGGVDGTPSPNAGTVTPIGPLGMNPDNLGGFDIQVDGTAYAILGVGPNSFLTTINLVTGATGTALVVGNPEDEVMIRGMAVAIPEPASVALLGIGALSLLSRRRRSR